MTNPCKHEWIPLTRDRLGRVDVRKCRFCPRVERWIAPGSYWRKVNPEIEPPTPTAAALYEEDGDDAD